MSIKQNGGVFGRNPTFNDVTIEGQLTFDGDIDINSDLKIDGDLDVIGGMTVDTNVLVVDKTNNRVAIGTDTIYSDLQVHKTSGVKLWITANGGNPSDAGSLRFAEQKDGFNYFEFLHNGSTNELKLTSTNNDIMTFNRGTQNVSISNGNLVMATSGKGIDFSATSGTGTSELLDDYEEGEFSVTLTPSTSGSIALQAGADTMLYNKVGRVVHCQGQINVSSIASAVGSSIAVNLPFAKLNTTDASEASNGPVTYYNTSAYSVLPAYVPSSATQAFNIVIDPSTLANGHVFYIQFSYTAA